MVFHYFLEIKTEQQQPPKKNSLINRLKFLKTVVCVSEHFALSQDVAWHPFLKIPSIFSEYKWVVKKISEYPYRENIFVLSGL